MGPHALEHQLTRMEARGWIKREKGDKGVTRVLLLAAGRKEQHSAAPVLSGILWETFFGRLTKAQLATLDEIRTALLPR